ncbi:MAG TPA: hypothetical protein VN903_35565 [Polyangia bacterium]|nr:hypothetical protein [Polyangia bacterium]
MIHAKSVQSWLSMMPPMNAKFARVFLIGMEVGEAYEQMVDLIRANPDLKKWKYVLTLEDDNTVPPDGILKLYEDIESGPWAAVGALYWTKGEGGKPMAYGRPQDMPKNFVPWLPAADSVEEVNGLGMGCTLFKMEMLLDEKFERPMFKTEQRYEPGKGVVAYTQDLRFFENAAKLGYRFACSTRVLAGHVDRESGFVW